MTYEAIKEIARYIGYLTGLISAGTVMGIVWNALAGIVSQEPNGYVMTKVRIKNLMTALGISLVLTGGLLSWAAGYIDGAASWLTKITGWAK